MKSLKLPMHAGEEEVRKALNAAIEQPQHYKDSLVADIVIPIVALVISILVAVFHWACA